MVKSLPSGRLVWLAQGLAMRCPMRPPSGSARRGHGVHSAVSARLVMDAAVCHPGGAGCACFLPERRFRFA